MTSPTRRTFTVFCQNCVFLRERLTKRQAELAACGHSNAYRHDARMVDMGQKRDAGKKR